MKHIQTFGLIQHKMAKSGPIVEDLDVIEDISAHRR
jgi:hypothetical protein